MSKNSDFVYREYYVNDNKFKKLYNMYLHQTFFDKILDVLVFLAIVFTGISLIFEFFISIDSHVLELIHEFSFFIFFIFFLELVREYARSKSSREFFAKHWLDITLIVLLSLYFLFATYFGLAKFRTVRNFNKYVKEAKHVRVVMNYIRGL